jgi:hypothetical protein
MKTNSGLLIGFIILAILLLSLHSWGREHFQLSPHELSRQKKQQEAQKEYTEEEKVEHQTLIENTFKDRGTRPIFDWFNKRLGKLEENKRTGEDEARKYDDN